MAKSEQVINIVKPNLKYIKVKLVGDSSLLVHAWSKKGKRQMLEAQQKKSVAKKAKPIRNPYEEYANSIYWISGEPEDMTEDGCVERALTNGAKTGFPVTAVKQAAIDAAYRGGMISNKAIARGAFFIKGMDDENMFTIDAEAVEIREDTVRLAGIGNPADLRYRAEYKKWSGELLLEFNDNGVFTLEQVMNMIDLGGFSCGIGEWRPDKNGMFGRYHVELVGENA